MNERIKLLAEQAEFSERDLHIQGDNFQRFAELIVKECAHVINQQNAKCYQVSQPFSIEQVLTKHFGVE
jgi:hypothetical protein